MISYLAGPYSSTQIHIRDRRYHQIAFVAAALIRRGELIYSPITAHHHIACDYDLPGDADYWLRQNLAFLSRCGKMYVLQLDGWKESEGVRREIEFATEHKIPIEYITLGEFSGENNQHRGS
jgi:hypothetical protein